MPLTLILALLAALLVFSIAKLAGRNKNNKKLVHPVLNSKNIAEEPW